MAPSSAPLGVALMPLETRRDMLLHLAVEAERAGYDEYSLPETWAHDVTVMLAEIATKTSRIRLSSGVLSVWSRSAGALAMAAATLHTASGGRFSLGLGASTPQLTEGLHDVPYRAPIERMRRVLTQVRALLRGERVPLTDTSARPLKLNLPPAPEVPLFLAGLNPATVRLAGELADGWVPFMYPRSRLRQGRALLEEGRARGGGARPPATIVASIPTVVARDGAEARKGAAWFVSFYLTSMGPLYPKTISQLGFEKEVQAVLAANTTRGSAVVPPDAEALLEELTVYGTPDEARARLARWRVDGAELPVLLLPPEQSTAQLDFALAALR